jgi:cation diffusion facilitator CzcD-associated flavoprotein CzcO
MIIFATGFDAADGNYVTLDIKGRKGERIQDHWADGPCATYGIQIANFPNLFMVLGPQCAFVGFPV